MALVELDGVHVEFPLLSADHRSLRSNLVHFSSGGRLKRDVAGHVRVQALNGIDLVADVGDRIGLIGRNGSGKTTLLRLLAGIYLPTRGRARVRGRISALLGGGLGVDDDLTGYEAIEYGGLLLGLSPAQIRTVVDDVVAFTELGAYLAMPLRTYSSGMKVRLSFAVATCFAPDILLVDEVIGAGDMHFVEKAKQRAVRFMNTSSLVFLASHSQDIIRTVCNKAILLHQGKVVLAGSVEDVLALYETDLIATAGAPRIGLSRVGEAPIAGSEDLDHPAQDAFDDDIASHWLSGVAGPATAGNAWIGYDFGVGTEAEVRQFTLRQWNGAAAGNMVTKVLVQCSDDAFATDVRTVAEVPVAAIVGRASYEFASQESARYWRLLAAAPTGGGAWGVTELTFNDRTFLKGERSIAASQALSSGYAPPHRPSHAFDGRLDTQWISSARDPEICDLAWLGYDFGREVEIRRFAIRQWDMGARPNTVDAVHVQSSNDRFQRDIATVETVRIEANQVRGLYSLPPSRSARFWRLVAATGTGGGRWGITELEFSDTEEPLVESLDAWQILRFEKSAPISYHHAPDHGPGLAFDGNPDTFWLAPDTDPLIDGVAWIGYDFGAGNSAEVGRFVLQQWRSGSLPNLISSVAVQYSDDGFRQDVRTADIVPMVRNGLRNAYQVTASEPARYWRLLANSETGGGQWGVIGLEFWDAHERLLAGKPPGQ